MLGEPEQFLHAQKNRGPALRLVVDRRPGSGWRLEMGRRLLVEAPGKRPRQHGFEGAPEIIGADVVELRLPARKGASQPGSAASASSERSGHASPPAWARNITR